MRFALFGSRKGKAKGSASHTPSARAVAQQGGTEFVVAPAVGRRTATTTTTTPSAMTDISPWACSTRASQAPVRMASLPATLSSAKEHTVGEGSLSRQSTQRGGANTMRPQRVVSAPGKLQSPPPPVTPPRARWTLASRAFLGHHPPSQHAREEVVTPAVLAVAPADHERRGSGAYIEFPLEARGTGSVVPPPLYKPRAQTKGTTRPSHSNQPRRSYSLERTRSLARKHTGGGAKSERENEWGACDARASEVTSEIEWAPPPSWWSSRASSRASVDSSCADSQPATSARSSIVSTASSPLYVSSIGGPSITPDARGFERDAEENDNLVKECATNTTNVSPLVAPKTNTMTTVAPLVTPEAMENRRFSVVEHVGSVTRASSSSSSSSSDVDTTSVSLNESVEQRQRQPQPQQFRSRSLDALRRSSAMTSSLESIREEDGDTYATLEEVANPLPRRASHVTVDVVCSKTLKWEPNCEISDLPLTNRSKSDATRTLARTAPCPGSFLFRESRGRVVLSLWDGADVHHFCVNDGTRPVEPSEFRGAHFRKFIRVYRLSQSLPVALRCVVIDTTERDVPARVGPQVKLR